MEERIDGHLADFGSAEYSAEISKFVQELSTKGISGVADTPQAPARQLEQDMANFEMRPGGSFMQKAKPPGESKK
jgi:hypothetical protein